MPRQRLGQNFLGDSAWRERIARAVFAASPPGGLWIEIGAGHGEMTALLSRHASRLVALELDKRLLPALRSQAAALGNVTIAPGDVLSQDLAGLTEGHAYSVYGNIPYYITSPILHHLFCAPKQPRAAFLVMQREVAERASARTGGRSYGYLSAFVQFHARVEVVMLIPPRAFSPPPKVDSALVAMRPPGEQARLGVQDAPAFLEFVKRCFAQKRKTLRNNLRLLAENRNVEALLDKCGIPRDARAEQLDLPAMSGLFAAVREQGGFSSRAPEQPGGPENRS